MYGDFSRMTFSRRKAYTGVWSQQGRVQLDADANEQTAIVLDWLRTLAVDFIGPFGGHVIRAGFEVELTADDLTFSPGHYYVYGLRCEIPKPTGQGAAGATYSSLVPGAGPLPGPPYLVQMLVWERSVSAAAEPDLLEPALGPYPPDTTVRSQVAWVPAASTTLPDGTKLAGATVDSESIHKAFDEYNTSGGGHPLLAARVETDVEPEEASIVPATAGYLGVENQLYRVEVHTGGTVLADDSPTFKWSRENGSAEFRIAQPGAEAEASAPTTVAKVTVASLGRDARTSLDVGDWVELIDDTWAPQGDPPPLAAVQAIGRADLTVTLSREVMINMSLHPYLRRWDQTADSPAGQDGLPIAEGTWLELEDGVQISFSAGGAEYQRGDYWLIPARTATGGLLWPSDDGKPGAVPPDGPARYLVPLALVTDKTTTEDMRTLFTHLAWPPEPPSTSGAGEQA